MILTLEVTGPQAGRLGSASRKVFRATGGTIGRLADNDWVLADSYVSGRHALIQYVNGEFYIEDTSRNGVFVNSSDNRLGRGQPHKLATGDRIVIDPYEIRAQINDEPAGPYAPSLDPFAQVGRSGGDDPFADPMFSSPGPQRSVPSYGPPVADESSSELNPLDLLDINRKRTPPPNVLRGADLAAKGVMSEHYRPPLIPDSALDPASGLIPADWEERKSIAPQPRPRPVDPMARPEPAPPVPKPAAPSVQLRGSGGGDFADVLAGAGLSDVVVTPEVARQFGEILRVVVTGVMDVMQARQRTKEEFRLGQTTFKPADNNPLKFSANVEDALHNLLVKRNPAYLGPVDAFEDAFEDLRNHQIAMLAGLRVAYEAMLAEFDPDHLQEQFDRQMKKGALLSVPAKLRYWDLYRGWIHDMVRDAEVSFRELFGDEFGRAYEEQLKRLKMQGRAGKR